MPYIEFIIDDCQDYIFKYLETSIEPTYIQEGIKSFSSHFNPTTHKSTSVKENLKVYLIIHLVTTSKSTTSLCNSLWSIYITMFWS